MVSEVEQVTRGVSLQVGTRGEVQEAGAKLNDAIGGGLTTHSTRTRITLHSCTGLCSYHGSSRPADSGLRRLLKYVRRIS